MSDIVKIAFEMDHELKSWKDNLDPGWNFTTVEADDAAPEIHFDGKRHIYDNLWVAQIWNNWRFLQILVNEIIIQYQIGPDEPHAAQTSARISIIHQMSAETCISAASFLNTPRKLKP